MTRARRPLMFLALLVLGAAMGDVLSPAWRARVAHAQANPPRVACSCERPVVLLGESVGLTAWGASSAEGTLQYTWTSTGGTVTLQGQSAQWNLGGVQPGTYRATVTVRDAAGSVDCSVQVVVRTPLALRAPAPGRESGWALLPRTEAEDVSYGLYSYVLFGSPPSPETHERFLKTIEGYLQAMPSVRSLEEVNIPRRELNIVYVPVHAAPASEASAPMLLELYDYARARALLRMLAGSHRDGPYLVSSLRPLNPREAGRGPYLVQDLSSVPPPLARLWMKEFLNQAAQERFWDDRTAGRLALRMRTTVAVFARSLPEVVKGLDTLITYAR
jgi:hypothetical protein